MKYPVLPGDPAGELVVLLLEEKRLHLELLGELVLGWEQELVFGVVLVLLFAVDGGTALERIGVRRFRFSEIPLRFAQ